MTDTWSAPLERLAAIDPAPFFVLSLLPYLAFLWWAARVEALCATPGWNIAGNLVGECLHLDKEWALAFKCWNHHGAWRAGATIGQKHLACIGDTNQTKFGHFE